MSKIDEVQKEVENYFNHLSGPNYLRILDTPKVWGLPFGKDIMTQAHKRQAEFERAIVEMVQKSKYRCDVASLNSPDPDWGKVIIGAMDTALTTEMKRDKPTQFRFFFGQTPLGAVTDPANYVDFKAALIRLVRTRLPFWEVKPEIWIGRFYRLKKGVLSSLQSKIFSENIISSDETKMTWNHCKIIAVDGYEALVGGHNLNMDLFRSYPPVHDVSIVVHGDGAYGAELFLNQMWLCGSDLLTKEYLDIDPNNLNQMSWKKGSSSPEVPSDPFREESVLAYMKEQQKLLLQMHESGEQNGSENDNESLNPDKKSSEDIRQDDLQTLRDLNIDVFPIRKTYDEYDKFDEYKLATRMLSVGKYWDGPKKETDYQKASELMKENLIKNAERVIKMSQMDLISAWKKNWSDHVVCHWIMEALLANKNLKVEVVVSPLDAGAGAEGDQYSFGSGAIRTFELISYYMTHNLDDTPIMEGVNERNNAMTRLFVAPLYYTDQGIDGKTKEGDSYKWPNLPKEGYTATLKQKSIKEKPPEKGVIGSAGMSVVKASGKVFKKVESAPGNHAKIMIVDDVSYVVGSDNLYPGFLSEFNYLIEGEEAVNEMVKSYWEPLWQYASPHIVNADGKFDFGSVRKAQLFVGDEPIGWLGVDSEKWCIIVKDSKDAVEIVPYYNKGKLYYRKARDMSRYLSVSDGWHYLCFKNRYKDSRTWEYKAETLISPHTKQALSYWEGENDYVYTNSNESFTPLKVKFSWP